MSNLQRVTFEFDSASVVFMPDVIVVWRDGPNRPSLSCEIGKWKPCKTHAERLLRLASGAQEKSVHGIQQIKKTKPALKVFQEQP